MKQDTSICHLNTLPNHYNANHLLIQYNIPGFWSKNSQTKRNAYAHRVAVASTEIQAMKIFAI